MKKRTGPASRVKVVVRRVGAGSASLVLSRRVEEALLLVRGERVLLDADLARLYGVEVKALNQAVKRNIERFPEDFMFRLSREEATNLKRQSGASSLDGGSTGDRDGNLKSHLVTSRSPSVILGWGGARKPAYAFTEQGVAMLSTVLRSPRAIAVNIEIMRAFVRLRRLLASHEDLARKLGALEKKYDSDG